MSKRQELLFEQGLRSCIMCSQVKELSEFYKDSSRKDGYEYRCKTCSHAYRGQKNKAKDGYRYRHLLEKYGLTKEQVLALYESQTGKCGTCRIAAEIENLHVDHCHVTEEIRGLLCGSCNAAIALLRDNPVTALRMSVYLQQTERFG